MPQPAFHYHSHPQQVQKGALMGHLAQPRSSEHPGGPGPEEPRSGVWDLKCTEGTLGDRLAELSVAQD